MSVPDWLRHDPLAARLMRMGYHSESAFVIVEQIAMRTSDGEHEFDATLAVLSWVPMAADESQTTSQKESL